MSMLDYQRAVEIVKRHPQLSFFAGERPEVLIRAAESKLDLTFPSTYRRFLLNFGAGNFGSAEFYGVFDENFEESGVPDAVWYTLRERQRWSLPPNLVVVYDVGDGRKFCLDLAAMMDNEAPIVSYHPGQLIEEQLPEVIAKDFGEFFLNEVILQTSRARR